MTTRKQTSGALPLTDLVEDVRVVEKQVAIMKVEITICIKDHEKTTDHTKRLNSKDTSQNPRDPLEWTQTISSLVIKPHQVRSNL